MADREDLAGGTPVVLWEEDYSKLKAYLDRLRDQGVDDLRDYFRKEPDAILECVNLINVLEASGRILEMYEAGSRQDIYTDAGSTIMREAYDFLIEMFVAIADGRKEFQGETVGLTPQGKRPHLLIKWAVSPESYADYGKVLVAIVDMSDRVAAEERLRESERLYRMLADNSQDLICLVDPVGARSYVSPSYKTVLGYEPEEMLAANVFDLMHPEDLETAARELSLLVDEEQHAYTRHRLRHKDGHYSWFDTHGTPLLDEDGKFIGGLVVSWNVNDQVMAEESLREANEQLESFLSVAAHELRHPITLMQGYAGTLAEMGRDADPALLNEIHEGVRHASGRLVHLVEELLEVSRIDRERFAIDTKPGDPRALVKEAVRELHVRGVANAIEVESESAPETWLFDHDKFRQLMVILMENAVNYSPAGSPVEVELGTLDGQLAVSVKDRGCGIEGDERERIFLRFYQVEKPQHHSVPGLGLGLYIAREIVNAHEGEIHHEERPGGGSIFLFTLP